MRFSIVDILSTDELAKLCRLQDDHFAIIIKGNLKDFAYYEFDKMFRTNTNYLPGAQTDRNELITPKQDFFKCNDSAFFEHTLQGKDSSFLNAPLKERQFPSRRRTFVSHNDYTVQGKDDSFLITKEQHVPPRRRIFVNSKFKKRNALYEDCSSFNSSLHFDIHRQSVHNKTGANNRLNEHQVHLCSTISSMDNLSNTVRANRDHFVDISSPKTQKTEGNIIVPPSEEPCLFNPDLFHELSVSYSDRGVFTDFTERQFTTTNSCQSRELYPNKVIEVDTFLCTDRPKVSEPVVLNSGHIVDSERPFINEPPLTSHLLEITDYCLSRELNPNTNEVTEVKTPFVCSDRSILCELSTINSCHSSETTFACSDRPINCEPSVVHSGQSVELISKTIEDTEIKTNDLNSKECHAFCMNVLRTTKQNPQLLADFINWSEHFNHDHTFNNKSRIVEGTRMPYFCRNVWALNYCLHNKLDYETALFTYPKLRKLPSFSEDYTTDVYTILEKTFNYGLTLKGLNV